MNKKQTFTLTFGDCAENHVGMQKIGKMSSSGYDMNDLLCAKQNFEKMGAECQVYHLNKNLPCEYKAEDAYLLVIKRGADYIVSPMTVDDLYNEHKPLPKDTKALMYGRVVNKSARYNLCFSETSQEPDYQNGKGTIIAFTSVPITNMIRSRLVEFFGDKSSNLMLEGNYYFDIEKCGIGFHGDAERRKVIGIRMGESLDLHYQWFIQSNPIGDRFKVKLGHGDVYMMSEKSVGSDWKRKTIPTLRHATGCSKFTA